MRRMNNHLRSATWKAWVTKPSKTLQEEQERPPSTKALQMMRGKGKLTSRIMTGKSIWDTRTEKVNSCKSINNLIHLNILPLKKEQKTALFNRGAKISSIGHYMVHYIISYSNMYALHAKTSSTDSCLTYSSLT